MSQDDVAFMKWSMGDHIEQFEQTLTLAFARGTSVRANQDAVLQADTLTRYQAHQIGITTGFLTIDEAREYEHRPPLPDKPPQPDAFVSSNQDPSAGMVMNPSPDMMISSNGAKQ
jgi:hypothetical protein